jgi:hypothetical protein
MRGGGVGRGSGFLRERLKAKVHPGSKLAVLILLALAGMSVFRPPMGGMDSIWEIVVYALMVVGFGYLAGYLLWWVVFKPMGMVWEWYWKPWD